MISKRQMPQVAQINNQWIQELFENDIFRLKLTQFIACPPFNSASPSDQKFINEMSIISQEVSEMIIKTMHKESETRFDLVAEEISKLSSEVTNLKNSFFGGNEKIDLETTCYNKSKLQISSILEQDVGYDFGEVKSSIIEMQQRFNEWFGGKISNDIFSAADGLNESKISQFISKKCNEYVQLIEKRILKRFETSDLLTQRRFEQVTKTMNNVLEMLNEAHIKKNERIQGPQIDQIKLPPSSQPSLLRQSSLQNLKIKSFFNFGHK